MLKKLVCGILATILLTGCSYLNTSASSTASVETTSKSEKLASELITELEMENMSQLKQRTVLGMFLAGDKSLSDDCAAYLSSESGNTDTILVVYTSNMDQVKEYVQDYLDEEKSSIQYTYPNEVFKVSNAILENNEECLILVIASDINTAKTLVENMLN